MKKRTDKKEEGGIGHNNGRTHTQNTHTYIRSVDCVAHMENSLRQC